MSESQLVCYCLNISRGDIEQEAKSGSPPGIENRVRALIKSGRENIEMQNNERVVVGTSIGATGAAVTAIFATLCCAGPAVVAVLGVGGAVAAASLEPYRMYLLGGAYLALAYGFWRTYWPRSGAACATSIGRLVPIVLWTSAALVGFATVAPFVLQ